MDIRRLVQEEIERQLFEENNYFSDSSVWFKNGYGENVINFFEKIKEILGKDFIDVSSPKDKSESFPWDFGKYATMFFKYIGRNRKIDSVERILERKVPYLDRIVYFYDGNIYVNFLINDESEISI